MTSTTLKCDCGSDETPEAVYDGHNIYLFKACRLCRNKKLLRFRADIMESYEAEEPIEPEEY